MKSTGKKALTDYGKALRDRIELAEQMTSELRRVPTQEELGPMPKPGSSDIYDARCYSHGGRYNFGPLKAEVLLVEPIPVSNSGEANARNARKRAEASKAANNGLVGVHLRNGKWEARYTYTNPSAGEVKGYTSRHECIWDAVAARESYVRRHYGSHRPWLFCDKRAVEAMEAKKRAS